MKTRNIRVPRLLVLVVALILLVSMVVARQRPFPLIALSPDPDFELAWSSDQLDFTIQLAWADYDNDGDLDMLSAQGNAPDRPLKLYRNDNGTLFDTPVWQSTEVNVTNSISWGDFDNDHDLDFAVGNIDYPSRIYRNDGLDVDGETPIFTLVWNSAQSDKTADVAWGDVDNDGDLDLALGNDQHTANRLYRNDGVDGDGFPILTQIWQSDEQMSTSRLAWGDFDNNGTLDLAVANGHIDINTGAFVGEANQLYLNTDGTLSSTADWSSPDADLSTDIAWGDYDNDGLPDLAISNLDNSAGTLTNNNRIYRNLGKPAYFDANAWVSDEEDNTWSVAWGDMDSDGDLDLAVGNKFSATSGHPNRVYRNENGTIPTTAYWSSSESDLTNGVAWADVDNDGDLDLTIANGSNTLGQPHRIYLTRSEALDDTPSWQTAAASDARCLAWGDVDGDGDLDLAVGNASQPNQLFQNNEGVLTTTPIWSASTSTNTSGLVWGDFDGDHDLDLAASNTSDPVQLYRNDNGVLTTDPVWSAPHGDASTDLSWGDYDGDGDLDLAVAYTWSILPSDTTIYRNDTVDGSTPTFTASWQFRSDYNFSLDWGDYDNDGDLDLFVGNGKSILDLFNRDVRPNKLFRNDNGTMTHVWTTEERDETHSVAWGDYDGDGDLDIATGNFNHPNRVYENDNGQFSLVWNSTESDTTNDIVWVDYDGDGDLDLTAVNGTVDQLEYTKIYRNHNGSLEENATWTTSETAVTQSAAWGDVDQDGDPDLALANYQGTTSLYINQKHNSHTGLNQATQVVLSRPGHTDNANNYSSSEILVPNTGYVEIPYQLIDAEEDTLPRLIPEYSTNGGGIWHPATTAPGGDGLTQLTTSADGLSKVFHWDAEADLIKSDSIRFRLRAQSYNPAGPILSPGWEGKSPIFRMEAPWFIRILDDDGFVVPGATVYANGIPITHTINGAATTNQAGLINPGELDLGTKLSSFVVRDEVGTARAVHDNWAYRTLITSVNLDEDGNPDAYTVIDPGEQQLILRQENPLILFNIVVSVEWDADEAYLQMLERGFIKASDYLYDVSDGQMVFATVNIYDNSQHWNDADFQFSVKNIVNPYAYIGGITADDTAHAIRVGRFWQRDSSTSGDWDAPDGYRTLIHEFGHYALHLYDEYFIRQIDNSGGFSGEIPAGCTQKFDDLHHTPPEQPGDASIMYWQYSSSELADKDRWTQDCKKTEQARVNGEADWQTVLRYYGGDAWQLNTPSSRGSIMPGPETFPTQLLPFPELMVHNTGPIQESIITHEVIVEDMNEAPFFNAFVSLYTSRDGLSVTMDQGVTDKNGRLTIYGARPNDTIRAMSPNGALFGTATIVANQQSYEIQLTPSQAAKQLPSTAASPYLTIIPGSDGDSVTLNVENTNVSGLPLTAVVSSGKIGSSAQVVPLAYSPSAGTYQGQVSFSSVALGSGGTQISGVIGGRPIQMNSDFNLQYVSGTAGAALSSEDGNARLALEADSLPFAVDAYAAIYPTGYLPAPLPDNAQLLGNAYGISFSGAVTQFQDGLLQLLYHPDINPDATDIRLYHWQVNSQSWEELDGTLSGSLSKENNTVSSIINVPGVYALGIEPDEPKVYLPVIIK